MFSSEATLQYSSIIRYYYILYVYVYVSILLLSYKSVILLKNTATLSYYQDTFKGKADNSNARSFVCLEQTRLTVGILGKLIQHKEHDNMCVLKCRKLYLRH